jgi:hypothetical protein
MRGCKLKSAFWQGVLQEKGAKQIGLKQRLRHVLFLTPSLWKTHMNTTVACAEGFNL